MARPDIPCTKDLLCKGARAMFIQPYNWGKIDKNGRATKTENKGYKITIFTPDGDDDPQPINFCPICGTNLKELVK